MKGGERGKEEDRKRGRVRLLALNAGHVKMRSVSSEPQRDLGCAGNRGDTYALTIGTTMTMIKITIPTPTMILHFMSFHLMFQYNVEPVSNQQRILGQVEGEIPGKGDLPHLLPDPVGTSSEPLCRDSEVVCETHHTR